MPRSARELYDGGVYHVFNRGHNKQALFHSKADYTVFKKYIRNYLGDHNIIIYHYVIMPNHFHLLVKALKATALPIFMKGICQSYAKYHHKKYDTVGYLYQNRYKCIPIEDNRYLLECARYIERNPLRANIVDNLRNYVYSSYLYYALGFRDSLVTSNPLYKDMGKSTLKRQKAYRKCINESRPYDEILDKKLKILC
ncbi:transposase [Candidatus Omnitrophota bacterium]